MYRYTTRHVNRYLWLQEKMHWKMPVQQVWSFMYRTFQVQRRRMLYLSFPIDTVGHCIRYPNIKIFFGYFFPYMISIQRLVQKNTYQRKLQGYNQKHELFLTDSFVLAHSSVKSIYNEQLTLKSLIQWYHVTKWDVI